ncbi:MAG: sigma-70 family RNA polymerase sigma factor [Phycisphaerales bacterium]|nr:sigma-70 family RNA polymerase sigma factor [Phycisphaerales bacterium]
MAEPGITQQVDAPPDVEPGDAAGDRPESINAESRLRLVRLAYRFLWDRGEAEDAVQDALLAAHERAADVRDRGKWWSWVCRIVVQRCHLASRRIAQSRKLRSADAALNLCEADESAASRKELAGVVREMIAELPQRQREVLVLRHFQGMSFDEIGEVLDMAPATARVQAMNAREALLRLVLERHPDFVHTSR